MNQVLKNKDIFKLKKMFNKFNDIIKLIPVFIYVKSIYHDWITISNYDSKLNN